MLTLMDVSAIIKLKRQGRSNREVAKLLNLDKKTVNKYWNNYKDNMERLETETDEIKRLEIQEAITSPPKYKSTKRGTAKKTPEFYAALKQILVDEAEKQCDMGFWKKQALTKTQIHELMLEKGFNVGYTTVSTAITELKGIGKECFIRQEYDFGDRLEYDFGEVYLYIDGVKQKFYLAVLGSPASTFRWCYLYRNSKKDVFLDSHVKFFEMVGGVWKEVVYDNMRNVVKKFLGHSEKKLDEDLIKMADYYGFDINVTNAFSGNEKGYVEGSVKFLRNKIFAKDYRFKSVDEAVRFMEEKLRELNKDSAIEVEKKFLTPAQPPLELADIRQSVVNKYSFVKIDHNFYSVPEYLVGYTVTSKVYRDKIIIYSSGEYVCSHLRKNGQNEVSADIRHYLKTLTKKPGALKNSAVLRSNSKLYSLYNIYYSKNPKDFIKIISEHKDESDDRIIEILKYKATNQKPKHVFFDSAINKLARSQTSLYKNLIIGQSK